jgi:hypothetical protein
MSHTAINTVSITTTINSTAMLTFSERLKRTSWTFRLLPLPSWISPATRTSLHASAFRDSNCLLSLKRWERRARFRLEAQDDLRRESPRRDVVCAAERGKEVIQRVFIGDVDTGQLQAPAVCVAFEEVVIADGRVEETPRSNARWAVVVIPGAWRGYAEKARTELVGLALIVGRACNRNRHANQVGRCCLIPVAGQS